MLLELIGVDVVDLNKVEEERALLDTEEDRNDFDERFDPWDYLYEYKGPFNHSSDSDDFFCFLPEGMACPAGFGCCYDIRLRNEDGCVVRIEAYDGGSYFYEIDDFLGIGTPRDIWSLSDAYDLLLRYKKQIRAWKKRHSTPT